MGPKYRILRSPESVFNLLSSPRREIPRFVGRSSLLVHICSSPDRRVHVDLALPL
jgi:hypothetical protein